LSVKKWEYEPLANPQPAIALRIYQIITFDFEA
jgi:hypothetical protein